MHLRNSTATRLRVTSYASEMNNNNDEDDDGHLDTTDAEEESGSCCGSDCSCSGTEYEDDEDCGRGCERGCGCGDRVFAVPVEGEKNEDVEVGNGTQFDAEEGGTGGVEIDCKNVDGEAAEEGGQKDRMQEEEGADGKTSGRKKKQRATELMSEFKRRIVESPAGKGVEKVLQKAAAASPNATSTPPSGGDSLHRQILLYRESHLSKHRRFTAKRTVTSYGY